MTDLTERITALLDAEDDVGTTIESWGSYVEDYFTEKHGLAHDIDVGHLAWALLAEARDEIDRLQAWKDSAMDVLSRWDDVWVALGRPGALGSDKSVAALAEALRLRQRGFATGENDD